MGRASPRDRVPVRPAAIVWRRSRLLQQTGWAGNRATEGLVEVRQPSSPDWHGAEEMCSPAAVHRVAGSTSLSSRLTAPDEAGADFGADTSGRPDASARSDLEDDVADTSG